MPPLRIDNAQFGRKVGRHAQDFGLNPANPASREIMRGKITEIHRAPDAIRQGSWRGLGERLPNGSHGPGPARFYIRGNDVVVTDLNGNFITILKDGVTNSRVINAIPIQ